MVRQCVTCKTKTGSGLKLKKVPENDVGLREVILNSINKIILFHSQQSIYLCSVHYPQIQNPSSLTHSNSSSFTHSNSSFLTHSSSLERTHSSSPGTHPFQFNSNFNKSHTHINSHFYISPLTSSTPVSSRNTSSSSINVNSIV